MARTGADSSAPGNASDVSDVSDARGFGRALDRIFLEPEDPSALGLLRALLVSLFTLSLLTHVGSVADYFSNQAFLGSVARQAIDTPELSIFFALRERPKEGPGVRKGLAQAEQHSGFLLVDILA